MKAKNFLLTTFLFAALTANAQSNTTDEGIVINGVKWATRNVDAPGTFAANSENAGMFYQWNRRVGWSVTAVPTFNSNGGTILDWDSSIPPGTTWEKANDPSPAGWRVPTSAEIQSLLDTDKVSTELTTQNGITGRKFTDLETGSSLFFPAAGRRLYFDGALSSSGIFGYYWSSIQYDSTMAFCWSFGTEMSMSCYERTRTGGFSVRAVSDFSPSNITVIEAGKEKTPVAYYSIMGVQLQKEPEIGIYIIVYENGTAEKVIKKTR